MLTGMLFQGRPALRVVSKGSTPVYNKIDFSSQKSGQYEYSIVMLDSTGQTVAERSSPFYWYNDKADEAAWNGPEVSITRAVFENGWGQWSQVNEYLRMIAPVATMSQRRIMTNLKDSKDTARIASFIVNFWTEKKCDGSFRGVERVFSSGR